MGCLASYPNWNGDSLTLGARRSFGVGKAMINKLYQSAGDAVADVFDGATVLIGGFGEAGSPIELIHALIDQGARNLTVVNNNTGSGHVGLAALIENDRVSYMICSFPRTANSTVFPDKKSTQAPGSSSCSRRSADRGRGAEPQATKSRRPFAVI